MAEYTGMYVMGGACAANFADVRLGIIPKAANIGHAVSAESQLK